MTSQSKAYAPPPHGEVWQSVDPAQAGFDAGRLEAAVAFARSHESTWPRSFYYPDGRYVGIVEWNETGPWSEVSGHVRTRGGAAGILTRGGRIVAEWGDPNRTDMTFSVAKSYLAVLAGIAVADGLIRNVDEPVAETVKGPHFGSAHNARITWRHLLQQSSEWQGEIWEKSDQVDHNRQLGADADNSRKGERRELKAPGSHYEYNDVRVNVLAYCLLQRFGRALPEVLRERVMNPIGASGEWEWHGYRTSWTDVAGKRVQSVSGGAHWGGGMFISARDQARLGLLIANKGRWAGREILPAKWVADMLAPSPTNPSYGYMWWLNGDRRQYKSAPESSVFAMGAGTNLIWVEPSLDIVAAIRWIDRKAVDELLARLLSAIAP